MKSAAEVYVDEMTENSVSNGYLRLAVVILGAIAVLCVIGMLWSVFTANRRAPYVVRIEPGGETSVIVEGLKYNPQAPEEKYFLAQFAIQYFSRDERLEERLNNCLRWFMSQSAGEAAKSTWKAEGLFEKFANHTMQQVRVDVPPNGVRISEDGTRAWIDMVWDSYGGVQGETKKHETAYIQFYRLDSESSEMAIHNPLGFQIASLPALEGGQ